MGFDGMASKTPYHEHDAETYKSRDQSNSLRRMTRLRAMSIRNRPTFPSWGIPQNASLWLKSIGTLCPVSVLCIFSHSWIGMSLTGFLYEQLLNSYLTLPFVNSVNISNAAVLGLQEDLNIVDGTNYNTALTIFFVPYIIFEIPSNILLKKLRPHVWCRYSRYTVYRRYELKGRWLL